MALEELEQLAVTVPEAAGLIRVGRSTGYALAASGEWPTIKVGTRLLVPVEGLRAWIARQTRATDPASIAAPEAAHDRATTDGDRLSGSPADRGAPPPRR